MRIVSSQESQLDKDCYVHKNDKGLCVCIYVCIYVHEHKYINIS